MPLTLISVIGSTSPKFSGNGLDTGSCGSSRIGKVSRSYIVTDKSGRFLEDSCLLTDSFSFPSDTKR